MTDNNINYYSVLGIDPKASKKDIEKAYNKLAVLWHPDKHKTNKDEAVNKFKLITKAYQVLSDDELKEKYDKFGFSDTNGDNIIDPSNMFENMFDNEDNSIPDVLVKIEAEIDRLYTGFTQEIKFERFSPCSKCDSSGTKNKIDGSCNECKGNGMFLETVKGGKMGYLINEKKCNICDGTGIDPDVELCSECKGSKYIKESIGCEIDIPPGAYDNYFIKLENEGNYIPINERKTQKSRSDVLFIIRETNNNKSKFKRGMFIKEINRINRADLLIEHEIEFADSIVGIKQEIPYLNNQTIQIEINDVILNNDIYVVEGKGMKYVPEELKSKSAPLYGDLFIIFKVKRPSLSTTQKNRLWQILTNTSYPKYPSIHSPLKVLSFDDYILKYKS